MQAYAGGADRRGGYSGSGAAPYGQQPAAQAGGQAGDYSQSRGAAGYAPGRAPTDYAGELKPKFEVAHAMELKPRVCCSHAYATVDDAEQPAGGVAHSLPDAEWLMQSGSRLCPFEKSARM